MCDLYVDSCFWTGNHIEIAHQSLSDALIGLSSFFTICTSTILMLRAEAFNVAVWESLWAIRWFEMHCRCVHFRLPNWIVLTFFLLGSASDLTTILRKHNIHLYLAYFVQRSKPILIAGTAQLDCTTWTAICKCVGEIYWTDWNAIGIIDFIKMQVTHQKNYW